MLDSIEIFPPTWVLITLASLLSVVIIVFICIWCWQDKKNRNQLYFMKSDNISQAELATNILPHIIQDKQKYFLHGVKYSAIDQSIKSEDCNHFSYNILSIFKNIQKNKFVNNNNLTDMAKISTNNLEDSQTEMHKNFDKAVLRLEQQNCLEKDETYSCISTDSGGTFVSVIPNYNRSHSVAETFKSINSEN